MNTQNRKHVYKKIALAFSLCALVLWSMLGTGASLAWFTDSDDELNNIFHVAEFKLEVSHRLTDGAWEKVDSTTKVFDEEALYEPGYVQVIYLKVENKGDRPFVFKTAVNVNGCILATNAFGQQFGLQDYLLFGLITSDTEEEMKNGVPDRAAAAVIADKKLNNYSTEERQLDAGGCAYVTLIVRMPEEVDNIANYRGDIIPKVELGLIVKAEQLKN